MGSLSVCRANRRLGPSFSPSRGARFARADTQYPRPADFNTPLHEGWLLRNEDLPIAAEAEAKQTGERAGMRDYSFKISSRYFPTWKVRGIPSIFKWRTEKSNLNNIGMNEWIIYNNFGNCNNFLYRVAKRHCSLHWNCSKIILLLTAPCILHAFYFYLISAS